MAKFIIQPHGRLNDWVADEKGYFHEEGLDYELNVEKEAARTRPRSHRWMRADHSPIIVLVRSSGMPKGTAAREKRRRY